MRCFRLLQLVVSRREQQLILGGIFHEWSIVPTTTTAISIDRRRLGHLPGPYHIAHHPATGHAFVAEKNLSKEYRYLVWARGRDQSIKKWLCALNLSSSCLSHSFICLHHPHLSHHILWPNRHPPPITNPSPFTVSIISFVSLCCLSHVVIVFVVLRLDKPLNKALSMSTSDIR